MSGLKANRKDMPHKDAPDSVEKKRELENSRAYTSEGKFKSVVLGGGSGWNRAYHFQYRNWIQHIQIGLREWILFRWFFVGSKMANILREEWNYRTPVW